MKWEKVKLGDVCEITSSKRIFYSEYVDDGVPFYRSKEIIESDEGKIIENPLYISVDKYNEIKEKFGVPQTGDMLLTSVGTIGIPYIIKKKDCFYFKDGNLTWFRDFREGLNSKYLYYWIKSSEGTGTLYNTTIGSSQKALTISALKNIKVSLPPRSVQDKIVEVVSVYDDLIENNQKQIKLLEEAAQRLYKEWFVDLCFPGHENTEIVDGVPEGWNEKTLSQVANVIMGQSPKSEFYNSEKKGLPFHQGVGSYGVRFVMDDIYSTSYTRIAEPNSILFCVRAPVGRLNITKNKVVIGRGLAAINQTDGCQSYLYYLLKNKFFKDNIVGNGSIFASVSKDELLNQKFLIPERNLMMQFEKIVSQMDKQIENLDSKNKKLIEARDRLLPKLMSGEVEV